MLRWKNPLFPLLAVIFAFGLSSPALAQHLFVGMKTGVTILEPISITGIFQRTLHPLVSGPVGEVALPHNFGIEASALHRQIAYRWRSPIADYSLYPSLGLIHEPQQETNAHSWEVPLVLKKYLHAGSAGQFVAEVGGAVRHTSSTTHVHGLILRQHPGPGPPGPPSYDVVGSFSQDIKTPELVSAWSEGFVIGAGQEIRIHSFRLQPELRYTRWSNSPFINGPFPNLQAAPALGLPSLQSKRDTLDFTIGVFFTH
jgi:hypothetical protein